ncbi:MAG TPA: class I SAM-dependent methyltransferase [Solirubrobacterales bacterium]|jgi:ubiquinone/menaquinone biosynthesis C-methylase UbiE|nr:class I SAM-dependent methyltransferase [Solirubrobacterales bacterium]
MAAGAMGKAYDATWGRLFARFYDRALKETEENGLGAMRAALLADASGRVVEIGAGTGVNLDLYGPEVEDLTLVEPDPHMGARLRERLEAADVSVPRRLVAAPAEAIPFAEDTFDTAVATLVLCTVPDPAAAISELARVLKPGGRLLFIEHVRSDDPGRARWQDRFEKPWRFMADGCYCNRDTEASLRASSFQVEAIEHGKMPKAMPIVRPLIRGTAVLTG